MPKGKELLEGGLVSKINDNFQIIISIDTIGHGMRWAKELGEISNLQKAFTLSEEQFKSVMDRIYNSKTLVNKKNDYTRIYSDLSLGIAFMQYVVPKLLTSKYIDPKHKESMGQIRQFIGAFLVFFNAVNQQISSLSAQKDTKLDKAIDSYINEMNQLQKTLLDIWQRLSIADKFPETINEIFAYKEILPKQAADSFKNLDQISKLKQAILNSGQQKFESTAMSLEQRMSEIEKIEHSSVESAGGILKSALQTWLLESEFMPQFKAKTTSAPVFSIPQTINPESFILNVEQQIKRLKEKLPEIKNLKNDQVLGYIQREALVIPPFLINDKFQKQLKVVESDRIESLKKLWNTNPEFHFDVHHAKNALHGAKILLGKDLVVANPVLKGKIEEFVDKSDISSDLLSIGRELVTTGIKPGKLMDLIEGRVKTSIQGGIQEILSENILEKHLGLPKMGDDILKNVISESFTKGSLSLEPSSLISSIGGQFASELGGSQLGGVVSGAISGAMIGGPVGAVIGGGLGLLGGLFGGGGGSKTSRPDIGQHMVAVSNTVVRVGQHLDRRIGQLGEMTAAGFNHLDKRLIHLGDMTAKGFYLTNKFIDQRADQTDDLIVKSVARIDRQFDYNRELMGAYFTHLDKQMNTEFRHMDKQFALTRDVTIAGIMGLSSQLQTAADRIAKVGELVVDVGQQVADQLSKEIHQQISVVRAEQVMLAQGLSYQLSQIGVQMNEGFALVSQQNQWLGYTMKGGLARIEDILQNSLYRAMIEQFTLVAKNQAIQYENIKEDIRELFNLISDFKQLATKYATEISLQDFYATCLNSGLMGNQVNVADLKPKLETFLKAGEITAKSIALSGELKFQDINALAGKLRDTDVYANLNYLVAYINHLGGLQQHLPLPNLDVWLQAATAYVAMSSHYLGGLLSAGDAEREVFKKHQNVLLKTGEVLRTWLWTLRTSMKPWQILFDQYNQELENLLNLISEQILLKPFEIDYQPAWIESNAAIQLLDGRLLIAGNAKQENRLLVYDSETGSLLKQEQLPFDILNFFTLSNGRVVAGTERGLMLYDPNNYSWLGRLCISNENIPSNCVHPGQIYMELPNGSLVYSTYTKMHGYSALAKQYVKIIDANLQKETCSIEFPYPAVLPIGLLSDSELLVTCGGVLSSQHEAHTTGIFIIDITNCKKTKLNAFNKEIVAPDDTYLIPKSKSITYIARDKETETYNIKLCDAKKCQPVSYMHDLITSSIRNIQMEGNRIYVGTAEKIYILDPELKKQVHSISLLSQKDIYNGYSFHLLHDGRIFSPNGWIYPALGAKLNKNTPQALRLTQPTEGIVNYYNGHDKLTKHYSEQFLQATETTKNLKDTLEKIDSYAIIINKLITLAFNKEYYNSPAFVQFVNQITLSKQELIKASCSMISEASKINSCTSFPASPEKHFFYTKIREKQDNLASFSSIFSQMIKNSRLNEEESGHDLLDDALFSLKSLNYMMFPVSIEQSDPKCALGHDEYQSEECLGVELSSHRLSVLGPNLALASRSFPLASEQTFLSNPVVLWFYHQWSDYFSTSIKSKAQLSPAPQLPWKIETLRTSTQEPPCYYPEGGTNIVADYALDDADNWHRLDQGRGGQGVTGPYLLRSCSGKKPWFTQDQLDGLYAGLSSAGVGMLYGTINKGVEITALGFGISPSWVQHMTWGVNIGTMAYSVSQGSNIFSVLMPLVISKSVRTGAQKFGTSQTIAISLGLLASLGVSYWQSTSNLFLLTWAMGHFGYILGEQIVLAVAHRTTQGLKMRSKSAPSSAFFRECPSLDSLRSKSTDENFVDLNRSRC